MKSIKNKMFAGLLALVFMISFSVSQVLLAGPINNEAEIGVIEIGRPCLMGCNMCFCKWEWGDGTWTVVFQGQFP